MKKKIKVTIHQPNFMPWLGYFDKINKSDIFVVLDHVEMDVKNSKWLKRVKMVINNKVDWVSIPLLKPEQGHMQSIMNIRVDINNKDFLKKKNQILNQYSKCPFYFEIEPMINNFFKDEKKLISEKNIEFIISIINLLKINTKIIKSSNLNITSKKNQMNIDIVKKMGGNTYVSGMGAAYQINDEFVKQGLQLEYSNFDPSSCRYNHLGLNSFVDGLSIIDVISNIGTKELIKNHLNKQ